MGKKKGGAHGGGSAAAGPSASATEAVGATNPMQPPPQAAATAPTATVTQATTAVIFPQPIIEENFALREENLRLKRQVEHLSRTLECVTVDHKKDVEQLAGAVERIGQLEEENRRLHEENAELRKQVAELRTQVEGLQRGLGEARQEIEGVRGELVEVKQKWALVEPLLPLLPTVQVFDHVERRLRSKYGFGSYFRLREMVGDRCKEDADLRRALLDTWSRVDSFRGARARTARDIKLLLEKVRDARVGFAHPPIEDARAEIARLLVDESVRTSDCGVALALMDTLLQYIGD